VTHELSPAARFLGFALAMLPLSALVWGLLRARRCFSTFAEGQFFSMSAIGALRDFALAVFASALLKPISGGALSVLLSWSNPAGSRALQIGVDSDTLLAMLFAGMLAVIASVLTEAVAIVEENGQFV
jgi:hypothetical protein